MSSPTDWDKFYQQNFAGTDDSTANASGSTATGGMMIASTSLSSPHGSAPSSSSNLSPTEGRVSKPSHARRRSRASRRTPTTLLNTDTTNFRAMVQQFTGGPNAPFASNPPSQSFGFGLGGVAGNRQAPPPNLLHNPNPNPNLGSSHMFPQGYRLQYHQPLYQSQGFTISTSNVNSHAAAGDGFFQRLGGNPRPPQQQQQQPPAEAPDGFFIEMNNASSSSSSMVPSNSNENRGNRFMF